MPELSPEQQAFLQQHGVDPTMLGQGGAVDDPFAGEIDLDVLVAGPSSGTQPKAGGERAQSGQRKAKASKKQSTLLREFYALSPNDLAELQDRLYKAGFFGNVARKSITFGDHDTATAKAYESAVGRAALFNAAGKEITLDEMLDEAAQRRGDNPESDPSVAHLTDPRDIARLTETVSIHLLGRKATESDIARVTAGFQAEQQEFARQSAAAQIAGGAVTSAPSLETYAADALRDLHPTEAGAHDVALHGNEFFRLLSEVSGHGA